jgi:sortase A
VLESPKVQSSTDDLSLLQDLLQAAPSEHSRSRRPAQLRSLQQQRTVALRSYRFRGILDQVLFRFERMLMIVVFGFFAYWLFNGPGRDWWYARQHPAAPVADLAQFKPGASAAEINALLVGSSLPYVASAGAAPAAPPDYLIPAQQFILPPVIPTATPEPSDPTPLYIYVPAMELASPVTEVFLREGVWEVADYAVGYHHGTAYPATGNTVMAGHAGIRGGVFARLPELKLGDDIYIETAQTRFHYRVSGIQNVQPTQVEIMYPTAESILTMITCTAWDTQRLVVTAHLVDQSPLSSKGGGGESRGSA